MMVTELLIPPNFREVDRGEYEKLKVGKLG